MALQQRDRRALKAFGVALGVWLVLSFVIVPAWDQWEQERQMLSLRENALIKHHRMLEKEESATASGSLLRSELQQIEQGLLLGETSALASAELQGWLRVTTLAHGIEVRSSQFMPERNQENGYTQVPIGVQFQCRLDQLVNFLAAVRDDPKVFSILRFNVQAARGDEKLVDTSLTLAGLIRGVESEQE